MWVCRLLTAQGGKQELKSSLHSTGRAMPWSEAVSTRGRMPFLIHGRALKQLRPAPTVLGPLGGASLSKFSQKHRS